MTEHNVMEPKDAVAPKPFTAEEIQERVRNMGYIMECHEPDDELTSTAGELARLVAAAAQLREVRKKLAAVKEWNKGKLGYPVSSSLDRILHPQEAE